MHQVEVAGHPVFVGDEGRQPRTDNGEADIARLLTTLGIVHLYEPFLYALRTDDAGYCTFGFTPDFWLPECEAFPECNIEVTWPDERQPRFRPRKGRSREEVIGACIESKRRKIRTTYELYGVPTLLLDHRSTRAVLRDLELLPHLIDKLHQVKHGRQGYFRPNRNDRCLVSD